MTPNMSYCMFENTTRAINQLIRETQQAIENGDTKDFVGKMRHEERAAFKGIASLCEDLQCALEEFGEERKAEERIAERRGEVP